MLSNSKPLIVIVDDDESVCRALRRLIRSVAMTQARAEGYRAAAPSGTPYPYHGYYYRILTAQGKEAAGGAYSYLVKGKMIGGFAVVAYPAEYGNSGIMHLAPPSSTMWALILGLSAAPVVVTQAVMLTLASPGPRA